MNTRSISILAMAMTVTGSALFGGCGDQAQTEQAVNTQGPAAAAPGQSMSGDEADRRDQALVRVVNAVASMPQLTVRWDSGAALPPVAYRKVSEYMPITRTIATFQVRNGSADTFAPVATNRELLVDGHRYTLIVSRDVDGSGLVTRIVRDDVTSDSSQAHVRVIHAAPGVGEVSVSRGANDMLFEDIDSGDEAGYKSIAPTTATLNIMNDSTRATAATLTNVALKRGVSYSIVVARNARNGIDAFWFSDALSR